MRTAIGILLVLLALAACEVTIPDGRFACESDRDCPPLQACRHVDSSGNKKRCTAAPGAQLTDASTSHVILTDASHKLDATVAVVDASNNIDAAAVTPPADATVHNTPDTSTHDSSTPLVPCTLDSSKLNECLLR